MKAVSPVAGSAEYCAEEVRRLDRDRWLAALFAPAEERRALLALYAFNAEVGRVHEQVSQPMLGEIRLQWWREGIDGAFAGHPRPHPVLAEISLAAAERGLDRGLFDRLLDARAQDLYEVPPADLAALEAYAEDTSGSLALLALDALGVDDPPSREAARRVGLAWALQGLMRAVPHHAAFRRIHLPADLLAAEGLDADAVFRGERPEALVRVVARVSDAAAAHLAAARRLRAVPAALPALLPARLADLHLAALRRAGFDPRRGEAGIAGPRKQLALLLRRLRGRF